MGAIKSKFIDSLTTKQVSQQYGIAEPTLRAWRHRGQGPKSFTLGTGSMVRYLRSDVEAWLEASYTQAVG